jgi:hypothetical protein
MKIYSGSGGVTASFLTSSLVVIGQLHPRYPFDRRMGVPQSRYGRCGKEKDPTPAGNRTSAVQPVAHRYVLCLASHIFDHFFYAYCQINSMLDIITGLEKVEGITS